MIGRTVPKEMYDELFRKYTELVEQVVALKRDGFTTLPDHSTLQIPEADDPYEVPDAVMDAIHVYSDPGSAEAQTAKEAAFGMLHRGVSEEHVLEAVHAGEPVGV